MLTNNKSALKVDGKWIKNLSNENVCLRGVCLPDIEAMVNGDRSHGKPMTFKDIINILIVDNWNANVVRLTIHNYIKDEVGEYGWNLHDPQFYYDNYLLPVAEYLIENGFYVIIDLHIGAYLDYINSSEAEDIIVPFWNFICGTELRNHPQVLFELFNEPKDALWNVWQEAAQPWVDAIRSGDWSNYNLPQTLPADNLLLIGGPRWSQVLPVSKDDKFFKGENIVYTCHIYPAHCLEENKVPNWIEYTIDKAPVFLTEWGYGRDDLPKAGPSSKIPENFQVIFRNYVDSYPNLSWTAWCFDYVYRPYMFDMNWQLLGSGKSSPSTRFWDKLAPGDKNLETYPDNYDNYMGQFVKDWLNSI